MLYPLVYSECYRVPRLREVKDGMIDDNGMFEWTAAVSFKPKVLFSYLGCQLDKLTASLVLLPPPPKKKKKKNMRRGLLVTCL